jgi:hypothetical protein
MHGCGFMNRRRTTLVDLNASPSDFTSPDSFGTGTPIQVSTYRQQVVQNTLTGTIVTTHMNTITETHAVGLDGSGDRLGRAGPGISDDRFGASEHPPHGLRESPCRRQLPSQVRFEVRAGPATLPGIRAARSPGGWLSWLRHRAPLGTSLLNPEPLLHQPLQSRLVENIERQFFVRKHRQRRALGPGH